MSNRTFLAKSKQRLRILLHIARQAVNIIVLGKQRWLHQNDLYVGNDLSDGITSLFVARTKRIVLVNVGILFLQLVDVVFSLFVWLASAVYGVVKIIKPSASQSSRCSAARPRRLQARLH